MTHYFTNASAALPELARLVMAGEEVGTRQGDRAMEVLHRHIVLTRPWEREIVTPGRKANYVAQIAETMWVLAGRNDVEFLSHYLPRAADFSDDGEVWRGGYGPRIRNWQGEVDQLAHVVNLLRRDPLTRRAVIQIYDPATDTAPGKDIPCNNWLHFISRNGKLDLHVATRSNDLIWGWSGINAFEWSVLQEIVAGLLGVQIGELHFSISSLHVYDRHWKKAHQLAELDEYQAVMDVPEPRFRIDSRVPNPVRLLDDIIAEWFRLEHHIRTRAVSRATLRDAVGNFPEPMLRSWLQVILWWWGDDDALRGDDGAVLNSVPLRAIYAAENSPARPKPAVDVPAVEGDEFAQFVSDLHAEKSAAYGDSWKRRGEQIGIMANIARKVDRLGVAGGGDTSADTAIDLLVYLIKYRGWLQDQDISPKVENNYVSMKLHENDNVAAPSMVPTLIETLKLSFDHLEQLVTERARAIEKRDYLGTMISNTSMLARRLWEDERAPVTPVTAVSADRNATRAFTGYDAPIDDVPTQRPALDDAPEGTL